jgi:hypothetical protein
MRPEPIAFTPALPCPACGEGLEDDRDGTSCDQCGGLLAQRVWAERYLPTLGRPMLPPVFLATPRDVTCPTCTRAMSPVLCHGVAAWSCARCRWLFFEGKKRRELADGVGPSTLPAELPKRALAKPALLQVTSEGARHAPVMAREVLGVVVLVALLVTAVAIETHVLG